MGLRREWWSSQRMCALESAGVVESVAKSVLANSYNSKAKILS